MSEVVGDGALSSHAEQSSPDAGVQLLAGLPLTFVENHGQWESSVRYLARCPGADIALHQSGLSWIMMEATDRGPGRSVQFGLEFEGASEEARVVGQDRLPGEHNFIYGPEPELWQTGIPGFGRVVYEDLYPGVDLHVYDGGDVAEYDLVVEPSGSVDTIEVTCRGMDRIELDESGALVAEVEGREVVQGAPIAWAVTPEGVREDVLCQYRVLGEDRFGFEVGDVSAGSTLYIDPVFLRFNSLQWSTFLGGSALDIAHDLAVAQSGSLAGEVTVVGETTSPRTTFPRTPNNQPPILWGQSGGTDVFVARLNPAGSALVYATYIGSSGTDPTICDEAAFAVDLTIDPLSEDDVPDPDSVAIITGYAENNSLQCAFPTTVGAWDRCANKAGDDAFVLALAPNGAALRYSSYLGGQSFDRGLDVKAIPTARLAPLEAVVVGWTDGGNPTGTACAGFGVPATFPIVPVPPPGFTVPSAFQRTYGGTTPGIGSDGFVSYFVMAGAGGGGTDLRYSTYIGGESDDQCTAVVINPDPSLSVPEVVVVGATSSTGFPTTGGAFAVASFGSLDAFVSRIRFVGGGVTDLQASTYLGGSDEDGALGVVLHDTGLSQLVTVVGETMSTDFATVASSYDTTHNGGRDGFATRFNSTLSAISTGWSTYLGGSGDDVIFDVAVIPGATTGVTVCGETASSNFPVGPFGMLSPTPWDSTFNGVIDAFAVRFKATGQPGCGTFLGSDGTERARGISPDGATDIVVAGETTSTGFPTTTGSLQTTYRGGTSDGFVTKFRIATLGQ